MTIEAFIAQEIVLEDELVRIEPLREDHYEALLPVAMHRDLWQFTSARINEPGDFRRYFDTALREKKENRSYPFAYFNRQSNRYAGSTRFGNIDLAHKRLEIGWTWLDPSLHGTGFNKHCKYLMLQYGFEILGLNRIELKTSLLNVRSQKAMRKSGAVEEGVFRRHMINEDGMIRDTMYFSFIGEEWPETRENFFGEFLVK